MVLQAVDTVIIFRILKLLTTPWEKQAAFKAGIIDKKGKPLKKARDLSGNEKQSYTLLHRLVFNLKRLLSQIPGGKSQIASYIAALALLKEEIEERNGDIALFEQRLSEMYPEQTILTEGYDLSKKEDYMQAVEDELMKLEASIAPGPGVSIAGGVPDQPPIDPLEKRKRKKLKSIFM